MYNKNLKPLTLVEAISLYEVLGEYLPDISIDEELDVLEYAQTVMQNIVDDKSPKVLLTAFEIMAKKGLKDLLIMDDQERLLLLVECIGINQLWRLNELLRKVGYGSSR